MPYKAPASHEALHDSATCYRLVGAMRLSEASCPNCGGGEIGGGDFHATGIRTRDLLHCRTCNRRFSFTAGTFFMGARLPLLRYVQTFVLYNALGEALDSSAACLAIGTRTPSVVESIVHRIGLVDPGIKFATCDADLASKQRKSAKEGNLDPFLIFCESHSILVEEQLFLGALKTAVNTMVPELLALYRLRGQRNSDPDKPTGAERPSRLEAPPRPKTKIIPPPTSRDVADRKAIAFAWQSAFEKIVPLASTKIRTKLAWHLARLHVDSQDGFAALSEESLMHTYSNPSAFVDLRQQYLEALPRYLAVKQALARRTASRAGEQIN